MVQSENCVTFGFEELLRAAFVAQPLRSSVDHVHKVNIDIRAQMAYLFPKTGPAVVVAPSGRKDRERASRSLARFFRLLNPPLPRSPGLVVGEFLFRLA